jgi:hypothetical protein
VKKLHALAELSDPIYEKILNEVEQGSIDFLPEEYIGGEAGIWPKLEKLTDSMSSLEELNGSSMIWGCLNVYYDEEQIEHWLSRGTIF